MSWPASGRRAYTQDRSLIHGTQVGHGPRLLADPNSTSCTDKRRLQRRRIPDVRHRRALRSTRNHLRRAMHHGCVLSRQRGREAAAGWWPTSPSSRWAGRSTTPASWPPTTSSICPATVSPQAAGTAPAPPAWGCRAKHPWPGSRPCSRAATPTPVSSSAAPTAGARCRPSTSCCGRPRACRSSTASVTRRPAGRCSRPITLG